MTAGARRRQAGFSLLEVIVALAILTLGVTSAMALFTAATAAHKRAIDRTHAASIAEQAFADIESALLRGASPEEISQNPPFATIRRNWPGYEVQARVFDVAGATAGDEILVEIRVHWRYRGQDRQQTFQQIIARATLIR
ncbi:MAG: prepilin-type N-terminal cleavage/methylation domain-containing protein [Planctomycetota bacterium]